MNILEKIHMERGGKCMTIFKQPSKLELEAMFNRIKKDLIFYKLINGKPIQKVTK